MEILEISRKISRKKVVVARKAFLEKRRHPHGNSCQGQGLRDTSEASPFESPSVEEGGGRALFESRASWRLSHIVLKLSASASAMARRARAREVRPACVRSREIFPSIEGGFIFEKRGPPLQSPEARGPHLGLLTVGPHLGLLTN